MTRIAPETGTSIVECGTGRIRRPAPFTAESAL
jgi:hypothetical protein